MKNLARRFSMLIFLVLAARPKAAFGQHIEDRFHLTAEVNFYHYESLALSSDEFRGLSSEPDLHTSEVHDGFFREFGIGLGAGLSEITLLSGRVWLSQENATLFSRPMSAWTVTLLPSLELLPNLQSNIRPFFSGSVGVRLVSGTVEPRLVSGTVEPAGDFESTRGLAGGGIGVHWFVTPGVSIDPAFNAFYAIGNASIGTFVFHQDGYDVGLSLGVSSWMGDSKKSGLSH